MELTERIVVPAHGRDYQTAEAAKADWEAGKDFRLSDLGPWGSSLCSRRDFPKGTKIKIRFNKKADFTFLEVE